MLASTFTIIGYFFYEDDSSNFSLVFVAFPVYTFTHFSVVLNLSAGPDSSFVET
jgi:hypothetical protein